jgi:acyl carrier protein
MEQKIIEIIAEYQGKPVESYRADQKFTEMGLDSLDLAELVMQLEEEGITVELSAKINTPAKLAEAIQENN